MLCAVFAEQDAPGPKNGVYRLTLTDALRDGTGTGPLHLHLCTRDGTFKQAWATAEPKPNVALHTDALGLRVEGNTLTGRVTVGSDCLRYEYDLTTSVSGADASGSYQCTYGSGGMGTVTGLVVGSLQSVSLPAREVVFDLALGKALTGGNNAQRRVYARLVARDGKVAEGQILPDPKSPAWSAETTGLDLTFDGASLRGRISVALSSKCPVKPGAYAFVFDAKVTANTVFGNVHTERDGEHLASSRISGDVVPSGDEDVDPARCVYSLVLSNAVAGAHAMVISMESRGATFSNSIAVVPGSASQSHGADGSSLLRRGSAVRGEIRVHVNPWGWPGMGLKPAVCAFRVEAAVEGGKVAGRFEGRGVPQELTGAVSGVLESWGDVKLRNGLAPGLDYPRWRGPDGSGSARPSGHELIDDLAKMRLAWQSEAATPDAWIWSNSRATGISGGYSDTVVAGGRVYLSYFVPSGEVVDEKRLAESNHQGRDKFLVGADDVALCVDARTGETVWRQVFAGKGINWNGKNSGPLMTPCVSGDRLFFIGSAGRVYALEAGDGATVWESDLGPESERIGKLKNECLAERSLVQLDRDFCSTPAVVGDVVVCNDNRGGLIGLDAKTGKREWGPVTNCVTKCSSPSIWRTPEGTACILAALHRAVCVDPAVGRIIWETSDGVANEGSLAVNDRYMVTGGGGKPCTGISCYRIDRNGATRLWSLGPKYNSHVTSPVIHGEHVYGWRGGPAICAELETGRLVGESSFWSVRTCSSFVAGDSRIVRPHLYNQFLLYDADPANFRQLGGRWWPSSRAKCTTPTIADGRTFFRSKSRVLCYDLRRPADERGFKTLLNGNNLDGWEHVGGGGFRIQDGVATTYGGRGALVYRRGIFGDFVLRLEFKQDREGADSGVFVRFPDPDGDAGIPASKGYQVEIYKVMPGSNQGTGAIDNVAAPSAPVPVRPPGKWNRLEVTCRGQTYLVRINGKLVTRHTGDRALSGLIGLQNHDPASTVHFRNVRVREG